MSLMNDKERLEKMALCELEWVNKNKTDKYKSYKYLKNPHSSSRQGEHREGWPGSRAQGLEK